MWATTAISAEFRKEEERHHSRNKFFYTSSLQINARFRRYLDLEKKQAGITSVSVYLILHGEIILGVYRGKTLLEAQAIFPERLDVFELMERCKQEGREFSFEEEVVREYKKCFHELKVLGDEIRYAVNANSVPRSQLMEAIEFVTVKRNHQHERFVQSVLYNNSIPVRRRLHLEIQFLNKTLAALQEVLNKGA